MTAAAACAGALGTVLLLPGRSRAPVVGGLVLLGAASVGLAVAFLDELGQLGDAQLSLSPGVVAAVLVLLAVLGGGAALLARYPAVVVPLLLVAAPLRPPLDPDPSAPLLFALRPDAQVGYHLPLYVVLAAAALALAWRVLRGERLHPLPRRVVLPAAALIALAALSLLWTEDSEAGVNEVLLFWLPSAALVAVVAHSPFPDWMPRAMAWIVAGLGLVFALVGLGQAAAGEIFFSTSALAQANAVTELFRTTSLFQDPSIYGRHLVVSMAVILVALWAGGARLGAGVAGLCVLGAALFFTYSQSSMVALAVVALGVALVAGERRVRVALAALIAAGAIAAVAVLSVAAATGSAADLTRNRSSLVTDTAVVFGNHPIVGVGIGGQAVATRAEAGTETTLGRSTSHTTPLTIAAELGVVGLAAYAALLAGTVSLLLELHRRRPWVAIGIGAVLSVLFVHALIYEGFFETAMSLGAIAVACAALRAGPAGVRGEQDPEGGQVPAPAAPT